MSLFQDLLSLLGICLKLFVAADRNGFFVALAVGLILAIGCWIACSHYSRLWNLRYRVTFTHHVLCCIAALFTLGFAVVYAALKYTKQAAYASVQVWEAQVNVDQTWARETFKAAYDKVRTLGVEDFSNVPPPGLPESYIPTNHNQSILSTASVYAASAARHFSLSHPFLSKIIHGRSDVPSQVLDADVKNYFATVSKTYPTHRAISMVAREVKQGLDAQVPRTVTVSRQIAVGTFLLVQFLPFGLVGIAAYKSLKVRV